MMYFNISKCKILQITTYHNKSTYTYKMSNVSLATVLEHNYLGIRLHHKLSWDPHINYICNKANRFLGFLKRNLHNAPLQIKEHVYKQLLLPSIEYCSSIWDPYHQTGINKLEMIQHCATRFVLNRPWHRSNQHQDSITDMLTYLKLAFLPALHAGEIKILWIACMNGIKQCIHGDLIFKEHSLPYVSIQR